MTVLVQPAASPAALKRAAAAPPSGPPGAGRPWHAGLADRGRPRDGGTVYRIAYRLRELREAFRLVYEAYLGRGLVCPNPYRMRVTRFHLLSTTEVFVAVREGRVISTMSLVRDGALGLPMEAIYAQEVVRLRREGLYLGEVTSLADTCEDAKTSLPVLMRLMGLMAQCARKREVDRMLVTVHPRHARFYQRFTAFRPLGGLRTYGAVCDKPAVALALDLERAPVEHPYEYDRFFGTPFDGEELEYRPLAEETIRELRPVAEACRAALGGQEEELESHAA